MYRLRYRAMKALGDASTCSFLSVSKDTEVDWDAHFCHSLLSISTAHPLKAESLAHEYLRETAVSLGTGKCHQQHVPSHSSSQTIALAGRCTEGENEKKA